MKTLKKSLNLLIAIQMAILFTSCEAFDRNPNTHNAESAPQTNTNRAYNEYEALQGKDMGTIVMPDEIAPIELSELYSIKLERRTDINDEEESRRLFKVLFKDSYNEKNVTSNKDVFENITYTYSDSNGDGATYISGIGLANSYYGSDGEDLIIDYSNPPDVYDPIKEKDKTMPLRDGNSTVGELCDSVSRFINDNLSSLYDCYEITPITVSACRSSSGAYFGRVYCGLKYKNIIFEPEITPLFTQSVIDGDKMITTYKFNYMTFDFTGKDNIRATSIMAPCYTVNGTKLDKIISLKSAAESIASGLAQYSKYYIKDIKLMYCCKSTNAIATTDDEETKRLMEKHKKDSNDTFEPTWVFYCRDYTGEGTPPYAIKLNAVTSEITLDM